MNRVKWKGPYVEKNLLKRVKNSKLISKNNVKTVSKNSIILPSFTELTFRVYNGKAFTNVKIIDEMVGHKLGEFVSTRKQFSYKKKKKIKMGQKTDARIFRQGITKKNWEFRNIEKNNEESSLFLYKTLEVQRYLNRFFGLYKMKIHNCKIFYSHSSLQVFISFYITAKTIYVLRKNLTKYSKKLSTLTKLTSSRKKNWKNIKKKSWFRLPSQKIRLKIKRIQKVKSKKGLPCYNANHGLALGLSGFQEILLESLIKYTKRKIDISVTLQNLNRHKQLSSNQLEGLKRIFKQLRKFVKNSFFKEAMNILFINILRRKSAKLLAEFISDQFRLNQLRTDQSTIPRKDNYFLGFIKQTTLLFVKCEASCLTGMKIAIKGRFNRAPRARTVKIHFGKFSLQSFSSKVDYYQSTAYTINGTFGVKVWLCENKF